MATKFIKGQKVKAVIVVPEGPVQKLRMDEDGNFFYLIAWTDSEGRVQQRWFEESQLAEA
jgi:hypothetical protein